MNYKEQYKSPHWQKKRLEIMKRDRFTCKKCGDTETTLNVHHKQYKKGAKVWEYDNKDLITLCEDCHRIIEVIISDHGEILTSEVRTYKSNDWKDGSKIVFASWCGLCIMQIYDSENNWKDGYWFDSDVPELAKLFNFTKRNMF